MAVSRELALSFLLFLVAVAALAASRESRMDASRGDEAPAFEVVTARIENAAASDPAIGLLQQRLVEGGPDVDRLERLGWLFIDEARRGDAGFFHLALAAARAMEEAGAEASPADLLRGHALHGLHRFAEAEEVARRLVAARGLAFDHGLLGDVQVDQGRVEEAARSYQRMMESRPGPGAFARSGHVRFLTGDVEGAVQALHLAASAVSPRTPERFAWTWSRLSGYLLHAGRLEAARAAARRAGEIAPDSAIARFAEARVLLAEDRFDEAIPLLRRAARGRPAPDVLWALAEALRATGREDEAQAVEALLLARGGEFDPRGFALWLAHTGRDTSRALALARRELEARADPYTLDVLAWAEHAAGDPVAAREHVDRALALSTPEPRFHLHAAAVAAARRDEPALRFHHARASQLRRLLLPSEREVLATLKPKQTGERS